MNKNNLEKEFLDNINVLLQKKEITNSERQILSLAQKDLENKKYFPKIVSCLRSDLTPLAMKNQLSTEVGELYLTITNHKFMDKGFGRGLITVGKIGF
ncbi:bacteriocin immunity protein [Bombilactobacillus bombi]|uniref:bacteriocin immunity protein n=1 Tax=Bombilactobacillus bombi TaxID=1303590 RepID=UPI002810B457|nr:bacteriocin immunity protein [Bombilactobacillus bombi]